MSFFCSESNRKELKAIAKLCRDFQSDTICSDQNRNEMRRRPRRREHGSHGAPCLTSSFASAALAIIISKLQIHKTYAKLCAMSAPRFVCPASLKVPFPQRPCSRTASSSSDALMYLCIFASFSCHLPLLLLLKKLCRA